MKTLYRFDAFECLSLHVNHFIERLSFALTNTSAVGPSFV